MKINKVVDVSRGDQLLSYYLKDSSIQRVLIAFFHGIGDVIMFIKVFEKLKELYPNIHFDLGLCKGLGEEEIYPNAILLNPDWREKFDTLGYDLVFSCNMPMNETQIAYTKGEWSCLKELGIELTWGHTAPEIIKNRLIGVHFQITCLPDSANVPYEIAQKVWNEIKEAGFIPIETLCQHVFHNPVNKKYDFIDRHIRDIQPKISTLAGIIQSCAAFICGVSGNMHVALGLLPPERIVLLEKDFLAPSFTKLPITRMNIKKYEDGSIKKWLEKLKI